MTMLFPPLFKPLIVVLDSRSESSAVRAFGGQSGGGVGGHGHLVDMAMVHGGGRGHTTDGAVRTPDIP
jgi:hypothetical protein